MKCNQKVNRKSLRRRATNFVALGIFLIMTGITAIECIPLGTALILSGVYFGYRGNEIEKGLGN